MSLEFESKPTKTNEAMARLLLSWFRTGVCLAICAIAFSSCCLLFKAMTRYPSEAMSWCPSGRWGSSNIERIVKYYQPLLLCMMVVGWVWMRENTRSRIVSRWAIIITASFWFVALIMLTYPWRWWLYW